MSDKITKLNLMVQCSFKSALRQASIKEGETMSVVIRQILREGLEQRGLWPLQEATVQSDNLSQDSEGYDVTQE